ncbi:MAG: hypothetical protein APR54_03210 [Candidatus Cloacimonas sp. SDB]|nr:MAG: hypothetical protein APR54_03210 [Candidatus Cloacimonas sp. SDB]
MILIFNTIIDGKARDYFTGRIAPRITSGRTFQIMYLEDDLPKAEEFSHLLITGSELSAATGSKWDEKIITVIKLFLQAAKPVLGICHGHQMIARAIAGDDVCRRAPEPEFGWKRMEITDNALFTGIVEPVFLESRYDEVCNLPLDFRIIAYNGKAEVQAFQYGDLPVWGVQFHPEMLLEDGNRMLEKHLEKNPPDRKFRVDELSDPAAVEHNLTIFENFFRMQNPA